MTLVKRQYFLKMFGLMLVFAALEWVGITFINRSGLPFMLSVLAYLLPVVSLFGVVPLTLAYYKNNPDFPRSTKRMVPARRYMVRLSISMAFYVLCLIVSVLALNRFALSLHIKSILAILTALPIGGVIWAVGSLIADPDTDEFERMILVKSILFSVAIILFFSALWGFLENFAEAPDFPLYLLIPVFFGLFGLVQPFIRRGYK